MSNTRELQHRLRRIEGAGYKAYQDLRGEYRCERFILFIDHVQGDPFASPSRIRVRVLQEEAGFPEYLYSNLERCIALGDIIARKIDQAIRRWVKGRRERERVDRYTSTVEGEIIGSNCGKGGD